MTPNPLAAREGPAVRVLTPRGRGAVATVEYRGDTALIDAPPPLFQAANRKTLAEQPHGRIVFGHWGRESREEVVSCRTSNHVLEVHCHGGDAAVERIVRDLVGRGAAVVETGPGDLWETRRLEAECFDVLTRAATLRAADLILRQANGTLRTAIEQIAALVGKDPQWPTQVAGRLNRLLSFAPFGRHLVEPWVIVLSGRPNVGKSSLMNALLGYARSIVFDQPGTTRDVVTAETAFDGWPLRFVDTAGIREGADPLEAEGIARATAEASRADLVLLLIDVGEPPGEEDLALLHQHSMALVVAHKSDRPDRWVSARPARAVAVSSQTGEGINDLLAAVVARLVPAIPAVDDGIPLTTQQVEALNAALEHAQQGDAPRCQSILDDLCR